MPPKGFDGVCVCPRGQCAVCEVCLVCVCADARAERLSTKPTKTIRANPYGEVTGSRRARKQSSNDSEGIIRIPSASRTDSLEARCARRSSVGTRLDDRKDRLGTESTGLLEGLMLAGDFDATKRGQVETSSSLSSLARANPEPRCWSC